MSSDDDFVMHSKIYTEVRPGWVLDMTILFLLFNSGTAVKCLNQENKGMHQSMFAFVVVVANTLFAVSDVTEYDQSTSAFTTAFACRRSLPGSTIDI